MGIKLINKDIINNYMNELIELMKTRRSIRKYLSSPVKWDDILQILNAAHYAPSSGNQQSWQFIVIEDKKRIKEIANACFDQAWIETAPVIIAVIADIRKTSRLYGIRGERLYAIQECAAAIQNMLLMAENIGIGGCWVGAFDEKMMHIALDAPDSVRVQAIVTLGYPDEKPPEPSKIDLRHIVYYEKYGGLFRDAKFFPLENIMTKFTKAKSRVVSRIKTRK